ncbi:MAG: DUF1489 family protein [Planktomarina sp.]
MAKKVHLVKLSVGTQSIEGLEAWQSTPMARSKDGFPQHITRMWPKREAEILNGGSIFWVIKGHIQCRQRIVRFDEVIGEDGIRRCAFVLDSHLQKVAPAPKRPFQGWRYLADTDCPPDLTAGKENDDPLPAELASALADIGIM